MHVKIVHFACGQRTFYLSPNEVSSKKRKTDLRQNFRSWPFVRGRERDLEDRYLLRRNTNRLQIFNAHKILPREASAGEP